MRAAYRRSVLAGAFTLICASAALASSTAGATPFRGGEYLVEPKNQHVIHFVFRTSRDLRWVTSSLLADYLLQKCRLDGRRVAFWMNFEMPRRMRITRDGRFSRLADWPRITGRFSSDGSKISVRVWLHAFARPWHGGMLRCPAHEIRFQALINLPAGDYAGTTAQGHRISFTLGGPRRMHVSNLAFGVTVACNPEGAVTHTYSGLSGTLDSSSSPPDLSLSYDQPFAGGTRSAFVRAEWLGATVSGHISADWTPPEPTLEDDPESTLVDDTSPTFCTTPEDGIPFTAKLVRRAPGT